MKLLLQKLASIFGNTSDADKRIGAPSSRFVNSAFPESNENATRSQLVKVAMRELVRNSGISPGWIDCQTQIVASRSRGSGIYVRLALKHWDARLMEYAFAFQKELLNNIVAFDPKAANWLRGISWQLEVASTCPQTVLPSKDFWLEAPTPSNLGETPATHTIGETIMPVAANRVKPAALMPTAAFATTHAASSSVKPINAFQSMAGTAGVPSDAAVPLMATSPMAATGSLLAVKTVDIDDSTAEDLELLFAVRDNELAQNAAKKGTAAGFELTQPSALI